MSHVYVPDLDKADEEDGDILFVPCKICGLSPGGDHRELDSLDPTHNPNLRRCHEEDQC